MSKTQLDTSRFSEEGCFVRTEAGFVCLRCGSSNLVIIPLPSGDAALVCANCTNSQKMVVVKREEEE